ncbi:cysteine hydrolase family protein [Spirochaeta cellobiosiphila]|uniref:cysteine hydrolase family protein n=1 Tax=Spirochaeta cellobiosiphila TaxID=504483 RepID=UPI00048B42CE|nr:isochorismatase family cysteine hydrolase [Spirochaeta cellobiosiphila]
MNILKGSALLVIDLQDGNDEDDIPVMEGSSTYQNAPKIISFFREHDLPVIQIREVHRADHVDFGRELDGTEGLHCLEGTRSVEYHPLTKPEGKDYLVSKRRYSAFIGTDLDILLRGLKAEYLYLIGGLTDVCVHFTAVDAHQYDYHFYVVSDCVTGSTWKAHNYSLKNMKYLQRDSNITTADILEGEVIDANTRK